MKKVNALHAAQIVVYALYSSVINAIRGISSTAQEHVR